MPAISPELQTAIAECMAMSNNELLNPQAREHIRRLTNLLRYMDVPEHVHRTHYTVLYVHDDNLQICSEHVQAQDGMEAMLWVARHQVEQGLDPMLIAAIPGLHIEASSSRGNISFPGTAAVCCSQFVENHED